MPSFIEATVVNGRFRLYMTVTPRIHAIILALNEEIFIKAQLDTIYPFCSAISVITQYDRDWYGKEVVPDATVSQLLSYPDAEGKINIVVRRMPDEAAARNMEMLSFNKRSFQHTQPHGRSMDDISRFHAAPDYFWIIDADEIYDTQTIPGIIKYLSEKSPRGMRVTGYNYLRNWNSRVPRTAIDFTHFGFIRPGVLFEQRRVVNWNESRMSKFFRTLKMPDWSARLFGFINCPEEVGVFHHGCWLGNDERIAAKFGKSSHRESQQKSPGIVDEYPIVHIPSNELPTNIRNAKWPSGFIND
jgi:hypothetical protein